MLTYQSVVLLTLATGLAGRLAAQDTPPCERPVLGDIQFLEGSWTVHASGRLSANPSDWETTVASATVEPVMRGCAFIERYTGTRRGRPYEAVRVYAAMAEGRGLQVALADSEHGPVFLFEGGPAVGGLEFYSQVTTPAGPVRLRLRFEAISANHFVVESQRSPDGGKTWDTTGRAEYRRRGP